LRSITVRDAATIMQNETLEEIENSFKASSVSLIRCDKLRKLPSDWAIPFNLTIAHCDQLHELPNGLSVGNQLDLSNSSITHLPADIKIGRYLDLSRTKIDVDMLPEGLQDDLQVKTDPYSPSQPLGNIRRAAKRAAKKAAAASLKM